MCGIFGCKPAVDSWLAASIDRQSNRGPDQASKLIVGNIGLAINRLAITGNLDDGSQPVLSRSKKTLCIFNGALFNYKKLIKDFSLKPSSKNDAAVALELFELIGVEFFNYIEGMFSLILVDLRVNKMIVGRDVLGIKPLYYAFKEQQCVFSSSIAAIPKEMLPFVKAFPPGCIWFDDGKVKQIEPNIENKEDLESLIKSSVESHIPEEVRWGCSLSGGIDSSIICAVAKKLGHKFNCYVLDAGSNEDKESAKLVASYLGLPLKVVKVSKEDVKMAIPIVVKALASYNATLILGGLCTYFISKEAAKDNLKVLLFGDGADEVFAGYDRYQANNTKEELHRLLVKDQQNLWLSQNKRLDHASMEVSIEARVPFQDLNLVWKSREISSRSEKDKNQFKNKALLRNFAKNLLPKEIVFREKCVMSKGSGLHKLLIEVGDEMWKDDYFRQVTRQEVNAYRAGNKLEIIFLRIYKNSYHFLSGNYEDLVSRKLYSASLA